MPSAISAPLCAAASMPYAPPLIIDQLRSTKPAAKSCAMRTPYWVGFLEPTMASEFPVRHLGSPLITSPIGGEVKSFTCFGQSG